MDFDALADFNLVATHGGFGRATRASGKSKATLSRHIIALERQLGVRLLDRGARALRLTDEGRALHERTDGLLNALADAVQDAGIGSARIRGRLRVSAPSSFAHYAMGRAGADFVSMYPEVTLEITADDRFVDIVAEGYDIVIRANPRLDDGLIGRCFRRDRFVVVAPPTMPRPAAADTGVPVRAVVITTAPEAMWRIHTEDGPLDVLPDPVLRLSSISMVREAVLAGAGVGLLPRSMVAQDLSDGRLACWGASDRQVAVWVLHASHRHVSGKVKAFVDFLCESFSYDVA